MNKDEPTWGRFKSLPEEKQQELLKDSYREVSFAPRIAAIFNNLNGIWENIVNQINSLYNHVCHEDRVWFHWANWKRSAFDPEAYHSVLQGTDQQVYTTRMLKYEAKGCVLELSSDLAEEDIFYVDFENPESVLEVIRHVFWLADLHAKTHVAPSRTRSGVVYSRV